VFERFIVDQIKCIGRDPAVISETLAQARRQADGADRNRGGGTHPPAGLVPRRPRHPPVGRGVASRRLADAQGRIRDADRPITQIDHELATLRGDLVDEREVATAMADFDALWDCLAPREQSRVIDLLVEKITFDGGNISITFRPSGIKALAGELAERKEEAA